MSADPLMAFAKSTPVLMLTSDETSYIGFARVPELLDWLKARYVVVLGMEGFSTDGQYVLPSLDHVADFSELTGPWAARVAASHEAAQTVIALWAGTAPFVQIETEFEPPA